MAKAKLNVYMIVDRSGSMTSMGNEAVNGINGYIDKLREEKVKGAQLTLVAFDGTEPYKVVRDRVGLKDFQAVTLAEIAPRGMTPLYDAAGKALTSALADDIERTVIVIVTDGAENTSREFKQADVKALIKKAEDKKWEVIFLGANFDAAVYAQSFDMGIGKFANSGSANFAMRMAQTATKSANYATVGTTMEYSTEEKEALK